MASIETLRKRFCKDVGLPINIFIEPYFSSRLELFGAKAQYDEYMDMVASFNDTKTSYIDYYDNLNKRIIDDIKNSSIFKEFNSMDMQPYAVNRNIPDRDIYKDVNIGKSYISIDMSKANYTALTHYELQPQQRCYPDGLMFNNADCIGNTGLSPYNYKAFIGRYTDNKFLMNSKNMRQAIFGNCNPKRTQTYEKFMMSGLLDKFIESGVSEDIIMSLRSDEIILEKPSDSDLITRVEWLVNNNDFPLNYEVFSLAKIVDQDDRTVGYIKEFEGINSKNTDGSFNPDSCELKCVAAHDAAPVMRLLLDQPIEDNDLVFMNDGRLAKYITVPELHIVR